MLNLLRPQVSQTWLGLAWWSDADSLLSVLLTGKVLWMQTRRATAALAALLSLSVVTAPLLAAPKPEAKKGVIAPAELRNIYNNKMALIGVLREGARQRAVASGDLQTLCLILGIGLDVTDRYLQANNADTALQQRRQLMRADLQTCRDALASR